MQNLALFLIIGVLHLISADFQPCITEEQIVCRCSNFIGLCNYKNLREFPIFAMELRKTIKEIHAADNWIRKWPNETIFASYEKFGICGYHK